jgi:hypothetical protein
MKRKKKIIRKSNKKCGLEKKNILNFDKGLMIGAIYFEESHRS